MKYRVFTTIGLRLIALYFFMTYVLYGINTITYAMAYLLDTREYSNEPFDISALFLIMPMALMVAISILLWVFAGKVANCIIGEDESVDITQSVDYDKAQSIGFSIVGVFVVANALPDLVGCIYQIAETIKMGMDYSSIYVEKTISVGLKCIIGIWLILGGRGIVNMIKKVRGGGNNENPEE